MANLDKFKYLPLNLHTSRFDMANDRLRSLPTIIIFFSSLSLALVATKYIFTIILAQ